MKEIIILKKAACMPASNKYGKYGKIGVLEIEEGITPKMISDRAKGVFNVIEVWDRLHIGKTDAGAFQRKLRELIQKYNPSRVI